ncbi:MAG: hypothetical protein R3C15_04450 [Thermoleophilia bacterium]
MDGWSAGRGTTVLPRRVRPARRLVLELPGDPAVLPLLRRELAGWLVEQRVGRAAAAELVDACSLAVEDALAGRGDVPARPVRVSARVDRGRVSVGVRAGRWLARPGQGPAPGWIRAAEHARARVAVVEDAAGSYVELVREVA